MNHRYYYQVKAVFLRYQSMTDIMTTKFPFVFSVLNMIMDYLDGIWQYVIDFTAIQFCWIPIELSERSMFANINPGDALVDDQDEDIGKPEEDRDQGQIDMMKVRHTDWLTYGVTMLKTKKLFFLLDHV